MSFDRQNVGSRRQERDGNVGLVIGVNGIGPRDSGGPIQVGERLICGQVHSEKLPPVEPDRRSVRAVETEIEIRVVDGWGHNEATAVVGGDVLVGGGGAKANGGADSCGSIPQWPPALVPGGIVVSKLGPVGSQIQTLVRILPIRAAGNELRHGAIGAKGEGVNTREELPGDTIEAAGVRSEERRV